MPLDGTNYDIDLTDTILAKAEEYLMRGWCQGNFAKTACGLRTDLFSEGAAQWCLIGAVSRAGQEICVGRTKDAISRAKKILDCGSISDWNDAPERTQDEVIALVRKARMENPNAI